MSEPGRPNGPPAETPVDGYSWYALVVLVLCYVFNYIDRNILSILAQEVKQDLGLSDARIGFLYGTAFAVFYAVFGIPFGRVADAWVRKNLIAIGLFFWSLMTAATGTAKSFGALATYRVGVGVGEASLAPSAYSMIYDLFPQRLRATALALYSTGITLGAGTGFFLGGWIVDAWHGWYPTRADAPFGLAAWQAAFLMVGTPGLLMALWVATLREPAKGGQDGGARPVAGRSDASARASVLDEFASVVPPFHLLSLWRAGAGATGIAWNLGTALAMAAAAWGLGRAVGEPAQWAALAGGVFAAGSWVQRLRLKDRDAFDSIFKSRAFLYSSIGFASLSFVTNGFAFWTAPFLLRAHDASPTTVGLLMGVGAAGGGWLGMTVGGLVSDRLKARSPAGRVDTGIATVVLATPAYFLLIRSPSLPWATAAFLLLIATASLWLGPGAAAATELVPPRMRSTASAVYLLLHVMIGFALGPFAVGKISDALAATGQSPSAALGNAMLLSTLFWLVSLGFLWRARRYVGPAEAALAAEAASA